MAKKKSKTSPFPEVEGLMSGMAELMRDENGNALTPDHPQYQKLANLMEHMSKSLGDGEELGDTPTPPPQGHA